jgi:integrase
VSSASRPAPRRGKGEGTIFYEESRSRWVGVLDLGRNGAGQRVRRKVTGPTPKEVREKLRRLRDEIENGARARNGNLTVEAFLLDWLEREVPKFVRSVNTLDHYTWAVRKHLVPALGKHRLAKLTPDHVDELLERRIKSGLAKNTVARIRGVLVTALDHADRRDLVRRNVAALTRVPDGKVAKRRSLTPAEARALLAAVKDDRLEALVVLGLAMGLRPGELTGLSWHDVDLAAGVVHMRQTLKRERNRPVVGGLKTERSRRSLACPPFVTDALKRRQAAQELERAAAGPDWSAEWSTSGLVFTTTNGTPIDASNLRRFFHRVCKAAGIGRWTPYEMRHSAASLLSAEGVPLERVADTLGHDGTRMVREVYRHAVAPTVDAAADPMQRLFGDSSGSLENTVGSPPGSPGPSDDAHNDE